MEKLNLSVKYASRPINTKMGLQSISSLNTLNVNGVTTKAKIKMKTCRNIIGMPTEKLFSERKLTKLIWLTVLKRNHIDVATVVTRSAIESVLILGMKIAVAVIGYIN